MKFYQSLKFKFTLIMCVIVTLALLVMGAALHSNAKRALKNRTEDFMSTLTDTAIEKAVGETAKHSQMLITLAEVDFVKDTSYPLLDKCRALTKIANTNPDYENIGYYNSQKESYTAGGKKIQIERAYLTNALNGVSTINDPFYSSVTNILMQIYAVPVYDANKKPVSVLVANVFVEPLSRTISELKFGSKDSEIRIMSFKSGVTIASTDIEEVKNQFKVDDLVAENPNIESILKSAMAQESGIAEFNSADNKVRKIASFKPIPDTDWFVICIANRSDFYSVIDHLAFLVQLILLVSILATIALVILYTVNAFAPLTKVRNAIEEVASGDANLTKRIESSSKDEIGEIVKGFNKFSGKLHEIISQIKESKETLGLAGENLTASMEETSSSITQIIANIESVHSQINNQSKSVQGTAGAVNEIASNIESLERMIKNQSDGVADASCAVEEMIGNISSVNISMEKMSNSFNELTISAKNGALVQNQVNEKIELIQNQSETLQEANIAISAIAEQTNLLAMNAAIEAAHAGDAGKGFAVVADEIRKLSETSGQQSKTIGEQLTSIQNSIADVVNASIQSSQSFDAVTSKIQETDELVRQIRAAMEEQNEGSKQISAALHSMNDSTLEVKTAGQEMAEGNKAILEEVTSLQQVTEIMQSSMTEMHVGAQKINETGETLRQISGQMEESISKIGSEIDQFKV